MPELPEVEITARNLRNWLRPGTIERATVAATRIIRTVPRASKRKALSGAGIERALSGRRVLSVDRRGKWIRLVLDDGLRVFSHLGMTGKWVRRPVGAPSELAERVRLDIITTSKGSKASSKPSKKSVRYRDPRMFGRLVIAFRSADGVSTDIDEWTSLGPDPLIDGVDSERLFALLHQTRRTIKEALLDQTIIAGLGNIQVTEALWAARIDPRARANRLERRAVSALARSIRATIESTLAKEDGPELVYVEEPGAENPFKIYDHAGEPCPRCDATLKKIVLGGRGTTFCPRCQRR